GWINALVGDAGDTLPAALLARNCDWVAHRLAGLRDIVQASIAETDYDLPFAILRAEAHNFATTATHRAAAAPIPEELGRRRDDLHPGRARRGSRRDGTAA